MHSEFPFRLIFGLRLYYSVKTVALFNMTYKTSYGYSISLPRGQGACIWDFQRFTTRRIVNPVHIGGELQKYLWWSDDEDYLVKSIVGESNSIVGVKTPTEPSGHPHQNRWHPQQISDTYGHAASVLKSLKVLSVRNVMKLGKQSWGKRGSFMRKRKTADQPNR